MESVTWLAISLLAVAYIMQRRSVKRKEQKTVDLSTQDEIDPTRWRHDGSQPAHYGDFDGNRMHVRDQEVLDLRKTLAF